MSITLGEKNLLTIQLYQQLTGGNTNLHGLCIAENANRSEPLTTTAAEIAASVVTDNPGIENLNDLMNATWSYITSNIWGLHQ